MTRARDLAAFVSNADGDIKFDTDTLFIDSSANRVGIGITNPTGSLHISNSAPSFYMTDTTNNTEGVVSMDNAGSLILNADLNNEASSSNIRFAVDGTERMRIDENGNIGLNEPNPTADIHMTKADDVNEIIMDANRPNAGQLIGRNRYYWNGTEVARMEGDAGSDTTNKDDGYLRFLARASGSSIAEKLRIDSDGLKFNGDTAAANALDDYEEGTWTPSFTASTTNPTITYNSSERSASYIKIGKMVFVQGTIRTSAVSGGSGSLNLSGLPFTAQSASTPERPGGFSTSGYQTGFGTHHPTGGYINVNTDFFVVMNEGDGVSTTNLTAGDLGASSFLMFHGQYKAD